MRRGTGFLNRAQVNPTAEACAPIPYADVAVTKQVDQSSVTFESDSEAPARLTYTLVITNRGPDPSVNTVLTDELPTGVTYVSAVPSVGSCSPVGSTAIRCPLGTMAVGAVVTITVTGDLSSQAGGTVTNTARVSAATTDPDMTNNVGVAGTSVRRQGRDHPDHRRSTGRCTGHRDRAPRRWWAARPPQPPPTPGTDRRRARTGLRWRRVSALRRSGRRRVIPSEERLPMPTFGCFLSSEENGPRDLVEQARMAERAGFETVTISDHFHPWMDSQGQSPFVWSVIGGIAATTGLEVTTAVTCPILRIHPAVAGPGGRHVVGHARTAGSASASAAASA